MFEWNKKPCKRIGEDKKRYCVSLVKKLIKLALVLPVATATVERVFLYYEDCEKLASE